MGPIFQVQQLGLPKESADVVASAFRENKDSFQQKFRDNSYQVSPVPSASTAREACFEATFAVCR